MTLRFTSDTDREPDHVNEIGTRFWIDKSITAYAQKKDHHDIALDAVCLIATPVDGHTTRLLIKKETQEILVDAPGTEAMCCHIDVLKFVQYDAQRNPEVKKRKRKPRTTV